MKKNVKEILNELNYEDLMKLKYDIDNGALHLKRLLDKKIKEIEQSKMHTCAECGRKINPLTDFEIKIEYGEPDFKRRAYLCSIDCLMDFAKELKSIELKAKRSRTKS